MKRLILSLFLLLNLTIGYNQNVLLIGNNESIVLHKMDSIKYSYQSELPDEIEMYDCILLFSTAKNSITDEQFDLLLTYVSNGKGLYCGAENYPLNAEFDQFLKILTGQVSYGKYDCEQAVYDHQSNLKQNHIEKVDAGNSIVSFPLDHRMQVDLWVNDQPLIASMNFNKGRIVLDGGYSRFYNSESEDVVRLWNSIIAYLCKLNCSH